ncbi:hypothetical protein L208DRAFT_1073378, partial [Tricholoma matsutake]
RKDSEFTEESTLQCPACSVDIHVGLSGRKNLDNHKGSKVCRAECDRRTNQSLYAFFKAKVPQNLPLISAQPPICASESEIPSKQLLPKNNGSMAGLEGLPDAPLTSTGEPTSNVCQNALELLSSLRTEIKRIPDDNPHATTEHRLRPFRGDPAQFSRTFDLNVCMCGLEVSEAEIKEGDTVMRCKVPGCETEWYHHACMMYNFAPKNWSCPSC